MGFVYVVNDYQSSIGTAPAQVGMLTVNVGTIMGVSGDLLYVGSGVLESQNVVYCNLPPVLVTSGIAVRYSAWPTGVDCTVVGHPAPAPLTVSGQWISQGNNVFLHPNR